MPVRHLLRGIPALGAGQRALRPRIHGERLRGRGVRDGEADAVVDRVRSRSRERPGRERERRKRKRDDALEDRSGGDAMDVDGAMAPPRSRSRSTSRLGGPGGRPRSESIARGRSLTPAPGEGYKDAQQKELAIKKADRQQRKRNKVGRMGEGDRHVPDLKPKHLYRGTAPRH